MHHKLIIFYGSSPGAGKSTASSRISQQLKQHDLSVQWLYEDDVQHLDFFAPVMAHMRGESELDMPKACLAATANLIAAYGKSDNIVVADSILPYYDWLLAADYDQAVIQAFSRKLAEQVQPLHPLIVYLQVDAATALQRAVDQRGETWLHELIEFMNSWNANKTQPIVDLADMIAYFQRSAACKTQLLAEWDGEVLWLDSEVHAPEMCEALILQQLGLAPVAKPSAPPVFDLERYVGLYAAQDIDPPDAQQTIAIQLVSGELWADLYWPNGCRLVAADACTFWLEDTSHRIVFGDSGVEDGPQLCYHYCGKIYTYRRHSLETL